MEELVIPSHFFEIKYNGKQYPGCLGLKPITEGANCQLFAYAILDHFRLYVPPHRSSELWEDVIHTKKVDELQSLDILFFNKNEISYGSHLGIYVGNQKAIHLSKEVGYPVIWTMDNFKKLEKYSNFIGAKRVIQ